MKFILLLLPVFGVINSAPTDVKRAVLVKRAQEELVFGNQQNSLRVKKSDPSLSALPDRNGNIEVLNTKYIEPNQNTEETANVPELAEDELPQEQASNDVMDDETKVAPTIQEESMGESESQEEEEEKPQDIAVEEEEETIKELQDAEKNQSPSDENDVENTENNEETQDANLNELTDQNKDTQNENEGLESWYESPYGALQLYKAYQNLLNNYPDYSTNLKKYYDQIERRYRRSVQGKLLKRNHRTKRDLPFADDGYAYYVPESKLPENGLYDQDLSLNPYELPAADFDTDGIREIVYNGEPGLFIPEKREELNIVPENKRDAYFYPFFEEPETHFAEIVPQKREYFDQYGRLVRLARALAMKPQGRDGPYRDFDWDRK